MGESAYYSGNVEYLTSLEQGRPTAPFRLAPEPTRRDILPPPPELPLQQCEARQVAVLQLINAYRFHGFRRANLDPLALQPLPEVPRA